MVDSAVGGAHPLVPDRGQGQHAYAPRHGEHAASDESKHRPRDRVDLSTAADAVLAVLRARVLARTRELLDLPLVHAAPDPVPEVLDLEPPQFLGHLLSEQNLLAAARAGVWPAERIRTRVRQALTLGAADAIDVLEDAGRLDDAAWQAIESVLVEFRRKMVASMPGSESG
jgi:hypothetical protein